MADRTSAGSTTSSITIAADRRLVLAVIADFASYPEWATGIRSAEVVQQGRDGRPRRVKFVLDAGVIRDTYVLEYEWDAEDGVRWELAEPGTMLTGMSGSYVLAEADAGTQVSYQLTVGTRMVMPGLVRRRAEKAIIDTALKGLKSRAETSGRGRPEDGDFDD